MSLVKNAIGERVSVWKSPKVPWHFDAEPLEEK
jgi:hypothetical protein